MAVRNDITVDWDQSPRIITIDAPSTEVGVQDLYDTLRVLEFDQMDEGSIVSAGGKETLNTTTKVGLTVTLINALLAFDARPGPTYEQCSISGGNLVAVDDLGVYFTTPVFPTSFTQLVLANSSSATLQEQGAIQYSSFGGGVTFDSSSPYSGTEFPVGTPQQPVNNFYDGYDIAVERGFNKWFVMSDIDVPTDIPLFGFSFIGPGKDRVTMTIPDAATLYDCTFEDAEVTGYLDGECTLKGCLVTNLNYIRGFVEECVLPPGTISLSGNSVAHFIDCTSGQPGIGSPIIDMGGTGQPLALRNYNGGITLINKTGPESISIDLNSGQVKIDFTTVTNGVLVVRGIGKLIDLATGDSIPSGTYGSLVILNESMNLQEVANETANVVFDKDLTNHSTENTLGGFVNDDALTVKKFIGLK